MKRLLFLLSLAVGIQAATISTMTCSAGTVTVNATGHGLIAQQGFSITGSNVTAYNINSTAASITTNTLTFKLACSGSASGGTIVAAKQIINTGSSIRTDAGQVTFNYIFWFTTSIPIIPACSPTCVSTYASASAAENAALNAGTTVEQVGTLAFAATSSAASVQATIQAQYGTIQTAFAAFLLSGTGFWYNGTSWVNQ